MNPPVRAAMVEALALGRVFGCRSRRCGALVWLVKGSTMGSRAAARAFVVQYRGIRSLSYDNSKLELRQ